MDRFAEKLRKLSIAICEEHKILAPKDSSIRYLWHLYSQGTKRGTFKFFIVIAELNLNLTMKIITQVEKDNILKMLNSPDDDSFYIGMLAITEFRRQRHKQYGTAGKNLFYSYVSENYEKVILNPQELSLLLKKSYDRV